MYRNKQQWPSPELIEHPKKSTVTPYLVVCEKSASGNMLRKESIQCLLPFEKIYNPCGHAGARQGRG